jgi:FtsH-binding integral membrane protein
MAGICPNLHSLCSKPLKPLYRLCAFLYNIYYVKQGIYKTAYSGRIFRSAHDINSAMVRVYNYMFLAVITSMVTAFAVSTSTALMAFLFTGAVKWLVIFAPLVAVIALTFLQERMSLGQLRLALLGFAAVMGLSMATIFVVYTVGSIVSAFMGASVLFGTMSFYGYFTKKDLDSLGKFMFVGLIAIIIASIVNIFIGSSVMAMVISVLAIIIFLGLTAYDTQRIREELSVDTTPAAEVSGALTLYMDFINLFLNLLQLFGDRK